MPEGIQKGVEVVKELFSSSFYGKMLMDLYYSSRAIYASIFMSIIYCIVYIYLMSAFAEPLAWICIFVT